MIINDNWFTKAMLVKAMVDSEKAQTQMEKKVSGNENSFIALFNQLLEQQERELKVPLAPNFIPEEISWKPTLYQKNITSSLNGYNQSSDLLGFRDISSGKIDQVLDGKLLGMGEIFVRTGQQFNVDPALLTAIAQHETGNGKSRAAIEKNNIAGMMGKDGLKSYSSVEESIIDMARNLRKNYLGKGLSSLSEIGAKYAPIAAKNDPTGLNNHWVTGVSRFLNQIRV